MSINSDDKQVYGVDQEAFEEVIFFSLFCIWVTLFATFLYYTFNAEMIIQQGTRFEPYQIVIALIGIIGVAAALELEGYLFTDMSFFERLLMITGGLMLIFPGAVTDTLGLAFIAVGVSVQFMRKKKTA